MTTTTTRSSALVRRRLLVGTAALATLQLAHLLDVMRYDDDASFPGVLADQQAVIGIGLAAVAFALLLLRHPSARVATMVAGGVVALGFVLHHGIPVDTDGVTNPYWTAAEGNRADWFRWTTVIVIVAVGAGTVATAWRWMPGAAIDDRG